MQRSLSSRALGRAPPCGTAHVCEKVIGRSVVFQVYVYKGMCARVSQNNYALVSLGQPLTNSGTQFVVGGYQKLREVGSELYISTTEDRIVSYSISNGSTTVLGFVSSLSISVDF